MGKQFGKQFDNRRRRKADFSLRRHSVDLTRLEHRLNEMQVAAVEAPWFNPPQGTHGAHG
jgi:hypothetical protein